MINPPAKSFIPEEIILHLDQACNLSRTSLDKVRNTPSGKSLLKLNGKRQVVTSTSDGPLKKRAVVQNEQRMQIPDSAIITTKSLVDNRMRAFGLAKNFDSDLFAPFTPRSHETNSPSFLKFHEWYKVYLSQLPCIQQWVKYKINGQTGLAPSSETTPACASNGSIALFETHKDSLVEDVKDKNQVNSAFLDMKVEKETSEYCKGLALIQDKDHLSELQCMIRENIEIFTATEQDANSHFR